MMPSQTNERLSDLSIESSSWPSVPGTSTAALTITVDDDDCCSTISHALPRSAVQSMPQFPSKVKAKAWRQHYSLPRSSKSRCLASILNSHDAGSSQTLVPPQPKRFSAWRSHTDSFLSILSAPSKISRNTTQHYIFTPPPCESPPTKEATFSVNIKSRPSKRGICNTMTIVAVVAVILFLFAGYPLFLYIANKIKRSPVE